MKNGLITDQYGNKFWYQDGMLHRTDGPAVEDINGNKCWYQDGKRHREDGPAVEYPPTENHSNGYKEWWHQGDIINCSSQEEFEKLIKLKAFW